MLISGRDAVARTGFGEDAFTAFPEIFVKELPKNLTM
jgi:hypothetical protein